MTEAAAARRPALTDVSMRWFAAVLALWAAASVPAVAADEACVTVGCGQMPAGGWRELAADSAAVVVSIPAWVTEIPDYAFARCTALRRVEFAEGSRLRRVGRYAFLGCTSLDSLPLPPSVTEIGEGALRECEALGAFTVPQGVTAIEPHTFEWCVSLRSVSLPPGLKEVGMSAFKYCRSLEAVTLPEGVAQVGMNAFSCCSSIVEIVFPSTVTELGSYVMSECVALRRAVLPANGSLLGELMFSGCRSLVEIVELSPVPPAFDCGSFIFEPDEAELYRRCRLTLKPGTEARYRAAPGWRLFYGCE